MLIVIHSNSSSSNGGGSGTRAVAQWKAQLERLAAYKAAHGDTNVPRNYAEDPSLGRWVSKQRHFKRKLDNGENIEGMMAERG